MNLSCINTNELLSKLFNMVKQERNCTVVVIKYLAELDKRQAYRELGYSSLFSFCTEKLRYSESAAQRRISAARCINKFPIAIDYLNQVKLNLTTLGIVDEYLTDNNHIELLELVSNKSKLEVERVLAVFLAKTTQQQLKPAPKADSIRAVNCASKVKVETESLPLFSLRQEKVRNEANPIALAPKNNVTLKAKQEFVD